jgi:hypothetical protein
MKIDIKALTNVQETVPLLISMVLWLFVKAAFCQSSFLSKRLFIEEAFH